MNRISVAFLLVVMSAALAFAQSNTGNLVVNVSDASGVIPGATVIVKDEQTGRERTLTTNNEGLVSVSQLDAGTYTVTITSAGRKTSVVNGVKVDVAQTYSLNSVMEAGNIAETVEITAGADLINSTTGELSNTVGTREIQDLPLNGRNPLALISLQAGTSANGATNTVINGQRTSFTNITRDGLNVQDNFIRANATDFIPDRPNVDDVSEFTITTQNAGVEAGLGASQVQLVTPRGSNSYHGSVYIFNRNTAVSANTFFNNLNGTEEPFLNRNQFGGRLGGPLPFFNFGEGGPIFRSGKDRVFFFVAYEGFRLRQSVNPTQTVLTANARNGIFTYLDGSNAVRTLNIFTAQQTGGPAVAGIDPLVASRILANVPTGNTGQVGDQRNTTGFTLSRKSDQDREAVSTRFDVDVNSKNTISGIYAWRTENLLRPDIDNGGFGTVPFGFQIADTYTTNIAWRFTPTGSFTNEVRGANQLSRPAFDRNDITDFFLTLPLITSPESTFERQGRNTSTWTLQDNAVYTRGNHSIRFGGAVNWFRFNPFGPPAFANSTIPNITIGTNVNTPTLTNNATNFPTGIAPGQLAIGNNLLALLGGIVSNQAQSFNVTSRTSGFVPDTLPNRRLHFENYSWYVGDQWRVNKQLTLNFGVRHEIFTPLSEPDGLVLEPVIRSGQSIEQALLDPNGTYDFVGVNVGDNRFFKSDTNNFAPNISVAWSPEFGNSFLGKLFPGEGRTVLRGGFSISFVNDEFVRSADNALGNNQGLTSRVTVPNLNGRLNTFSPVLPAPTFQVPRTYVQNNALAGNFGTVFAIDPDVQTPSLQQYNIGITREIGFKTALEVRYVGSRSNNLLRGLDLNQIIIGPNGFLEDFNRALNNCILQGATLPGTGTSLQKCTNAGFNAAIPGSQPTPFFNSLPNGGLLNNATILGFIRNPRPADLAFLYITNPGTFPGVSPRFLPNPNTGVVDLINNSARSTYNSLQVEVRRRFSQGFGFQANYTLQRAMSDASGVGQTRFDPLIDNANPENEFARADFDQQHVFNLNALYELPFGKGKRFFNTGGFVDALIGGWNFTSIVRIASGAPITFTDLGGTLNRAGRSGRQTASSNLTAEEISSLIGIFRTPCGVFFINPSVININQANLASGNCGPNNANLLIGGTGQASRGFDPSGTPFAGQVFFNNAPGQTGNLPRNAFNGPLFVNWDASLFKTFSITERVRFQIRGELFNVLNRPNFFAGIFNANGNINSANFGRITTTFAARQVQFGGRLEF